MIIKITPDKQKAYALVKMADITLKRLNEINPVNYPSNTLTDYYDILHKLMESLTLTIGLKFKGEGAHQELIDYISKNYNLGEQTRLFLQQLRDYRNRISYEGFMINKNFILQNKNKLDSLIEQFKNTKL